MRFAAPRRPFEQRDHEPTQRHHADDLERTQLGQRQAGRERGEEEDFEGESRSLAVEHRLVLR